MPKNDISNARMVGGTLAGLAVVSEPSVRCQVLRPENGVAVVTNRFWFAPPDVVEGKTKPYSNSGVTRLLIQTYNMDNDDPALRARLHNQYSYIRGKVLDWQCRLHEWHWPDRIVTDSGVLHE